MSLKMPEGLVVGIFLYWKAFVLTHDNMLKNARGAGSRYFFYTGRPINSKGQGVWGNLG